VSHAAVWLAAMAAGGLVTVSVQAAEPTHAALIAAAKRAPLRQLDSPPYPCDTDTTIEAWLKRLVGRDGRAITWTGGECQLVNTPNPIDAKSWPYCAQATITLLHPKDRDDKPMIEIYMEKPKGGRPGEVYAFRGVMMTKDDGPDLLRLRIDFESEWLARFPHPDDTQDCSND
jgi:hypothetical protein